MSLVDQVRKIERQVMDRLKELEPLTREYDQLRKVAQRLGLNYTPGSAKSDDGAAPSAARRGTAKPAAAVKRRARKPAKAKAAQTRGRGAAKPPSTRSTIAPKAKASAKASAKTSGASGTAARARPRKRAATSRQASSGRRAAAQPGQRHADVLRLVGENPGITVRELGERLSVDPTGLYRVVKQLTDEGRVRKDGVRLQPVGTPTTSEPKPAATSDTAKQMPAPRTGEAPSTDAEPAPAVAGSAPSGSR